MRHESENMLDYAFDNYTTKQFLAQNQIVKKDYEIEGANNKTVVLYAKDDIKLLLKKGEEELCNTKLVVIDEDITLPLNKEDKVGTFYVYLNDKVIGSSDIIVKQDLFEKSFSYSLKSILNDWIY